MMSAQSARRAPSFGLASHASSKLRRMRGSSNALPPVPPKTESSVSVASSSMSPLSPAATTFQDRLVEALVKRIKQSLPFFSGQDLTAVEADESVKQTVDTMVEMARASVNMIVRQLAEILLMLDKQRDLNLEHKLNVQVLQSQLLLIKILDVCVSFHWHCHRERYLGIGYPVNGSATSLSSNAPYAQGNHPSTIAHTSATPWVDPPVLDENLAKTTLDLVSSVLRRSAGQGSSDLSFHDFETIEASAILTPSDSPNSSTTSLPQAPPKSTNASTTTGNTTNTGTETKEGSGGSAQGSSSGSSSRSKVPQDPFAVHHKPFALRATYITLAQQPAALHTLLAKFSGRIVFYLSASNWSTVYTAFRQTLFSPATHMDESADMTNLKLVANCALDRKKLVQVLTDVGSMMVSFKRDLQVRMAAGIGTAVWNWIDIFPDEFREASQSSRALHGAPERVFDAYYQILDETNRQHLWPALSALLSISPERIRQAERAGGGFSGLFSRASSRKPSHFLENVARGLLHTRTLDASLAAYNALCRAAIHIPPQAGNIAIRALAPDLAEAIRVRLMNPSPPLKGFYETTDPIDLRVVSEAMVTIFRFDPNMALDTVFIPCLAPNRSDGVKCCVVRALITLATEANRMQWQASLTMLYPDITPILRELFGNLCLRKKEVGPDGRAAYRSQLPRIKQDGQTSDRELLMLAIMSLWRLDLGFFFYGITEDQTRTFVREAGQMLLRKESTLLRSSGARTFGGFFSFALSFQPGDECYDGGIYYLTAGMPVTLSFGGDMFMKNADVMPIQALGIQQMSAVLPVYANPMVPDVGGWKTSPVRVPSFAAAEIVLLVALTSHNTDQSNLAASTLRALASAEMLTLDVLPHPAYLTSEEANLRWYAYKQLADPDALVAGRLANQKRIRRLLHNIAFVNGVNIMAWEECFRRWLSLTPYVKSVRDVAKRSIPETDGRSIEDIQNDWQHLCLFLASFGGCCATDLSAPEIEVPKLPPDFLPGRHHISQAPKEMMRQFIATVKDLMLSDNRMVRETAREALGSELHPSLFHLLLPQIEKSMVAALSPKGQVDWEPTRVLFVDQLVTMFKSLVERTDTPQHGSGADGSQMLLQFAAFIQNADNSEAAFRLKMKFCALTEVVFSKRDMFPMRNESSLRKELLDKLFDWVAAAQAMSGQSPLARLYIDCEIAGLKACATLLQNQSLSSLEGKPTMGHNPDSTNIASMLFYRYFSTFMAALGRDEPQVDGLSSHSVSSSLKGRRTSSDAVMVKKLVVDGLVNMLIANNDVGPKYCLTLGFSDDITRRTVFAEVFSRLVRQGTKFDTAKPSEKVTPRMQLCDHIKTSTPLLALAICQCCPESEAESMISVMLRIFNTRRSAMSLLKAVIDQELQSSKNSMGHFRNNSIRVRLLSTFAKLQAEEYLRQLINPIVEHMAAVPEAQYETDPLKAGPYMLDDNVTNLEVITQMFLNSLFNSVDLIPSVIRELCSHIYRSMSDQSPEEQILPVISFIFLRVISPGLAVPDSIGVDMPSDSEGIGRGLILIAKTIQTLANNTRLSNAYKASTASVTANVMAMMQFCQSIVADCVVEMEDPVISIPYDESDGIMLHRFLHANSDKISRELQALPAFSCLDEDRTIRNAAWDGVSALLLELGQPMEVARFESLGTRELSPFREFSQRNNIRNTDSVKDIFVKISAPKGGRAVFGLFMSRINVETDDVELLMVHIFLSLNSINLHKCPFDIIVDCSGFTSSSEIPLTWWMTCMSLIPEDLLRRLNSVYIVNANIAAQRFLRKLYYVGPFTGPPGTESCTISAVTSWLDLRDAIPHLDIDNISKTSAMDTEPRETFDGLEFHQVPEPPLRVTFELASSHIRIISKRPQQIWPGLACKFTEIVALEEIGELLAISASGEDEFVIRPQHGRPSYLTSKNMPIIVNAVRSATGKLKAYQPALSKETTRVEATTATLINVALVNMSHRDEELRLAMLNLLHDVANFLGLQNLPPLPPHGSFVPSNPFAIASDFSKRLANSFPDLTLDFLSEFSGSLSKYEPEQRPTAVQHVAPWVRNLALFCNPTSPHFDSTGVKLRETLRMLLEMTVKHDEVYGIIQRHVWVEISRLETDTVNAVLDELIFAATTSGIGTRSCEVVADTLVSLASIHVRGKLLAKLRKAFSKESIINHKSLSDDGAWHQLAALTRLCLVACHHGRFPYQIQLFVPELVHAIVLTVCHGPIILRTSLHNMACNMVQALHLARFDDQDASRTLTGILDELLTDEVTMFFGIQRAGPGEDYEPVRVGSDAHIASVEGLTSLFQRVIEAAAASDTLANVWKTRWMSLISSCAMYMWPAIQSRAFLAFACLATRDVDDGFVAHMLGCLRDALTNPRDVDLTQVSIMLRALSTVVPILTQNSIYLPQLFWVGAGVVASTSNTLYSEAARLMQAVVVELEAQGAFDDRGMTSVLVEAREPLTETVTQMEDMLSLSFDSSFSFSMASVIFRGVRNSLLRPAAESLLRTLLQVNARTMRHARHNPEGPHRPLDEGSLPFVLSLLSYSTTLESFVRLLQDAEAGSGWFDSARVRGPEAVPVVPVDMLAISDVRTAILHSSFLVATLPNAAGDASERDIMYRVLSDTASLYPQIVALACKHALNSTGSLDDSLNSVFASSSSQSMASALTLLRLSIFDFGAHVNGLPSPGVSSLAGIGSLMMAPYAPSISDSLGGDSISLQSTTEMSTLLDTYSMDGLLSISTQLLPENPVFYEKMLHVVADMVGAMLG